MWRLSSIAIVAALGAAAQPLTADVPQVAERAAAPTVSITGASVIGSSDGIVESFKGIPYAQPPVGSLRLKAPQPLKASLGTVQATGIPRACPQFYSQVNTTNLPSDIVGTFLNSYVGQALQNSGEDCLTVNVQRPTGTSASSKLPVVFWMYGGGFEFGSTQTYDGSPLVSQSIGTGQPVLYVAVNYRVAGFGFLAGKQLQNEGSTNLGYRDQRLAMQWVQDNIAAFGGDPEKVTLWGESAGAISAFSHTIINRGDNTYKGKPLFRAAIMDSGSYLPALNVDSAPAQAIFDQVASNSGCDPKSASVLDCLRGKPYETFLNAAASVPGLFGPRSVNLAYLPRPDPRDSFFPANPSTLVNGGQVAKVPVITGDQKDEGTLFSLSIANISTPDAMTDFLKSFFPTASRDQVARHVKSYSTDPAAGSPFDTGVANQLYPGFKFNAAILGDLSFTLTRRIYLNDIVKQGVKTFSYLSQYYAGTPFLGTFHASDVAAAFFNLPPAVGATVRQFYLNFATNLDPNVGFPVPSWPQWTAAAPTLFHFENLAQGNGLIQDTFRQLQYEALKANEGVYLM